MRRKRYKMGKVIFIFILGRQPTCSCILMLGMLIHKRTTREHDCIYLLSSQCLWSRPFYNYNSKKMVWILSTMPKKTSKWSVIIFHSKENKKLWHQAQNRLKHDITNKSSDNNVLIGQLNFKLNLPTGWTSFIFIIIRPNEIHIFSTTGLIANCKQQTVESLLLLFINTQSNLSQISKFTRFLG